MCKVKKLKKQMKAEVRRLNSRIDGLTERLEYLDRERSKAAHPSVMTPEARNWCDIINKEYEAASIAAITRHEKTKTKRKRVVFRRVRADLHSTEFAVSRAQVSHLSGLKVGYEIRTHPERSFRNEFLLQFTPFITPLDPKVLTRRVNSILGDSGDVYAEVQILD